jgi:hypothetical protein
MITLTGRMSLKYFVWKGPSGTIVTKEKLMRL